MADASGQQWDGVPLDGLKFDELPYVSGEFDSNRTFQQGGKNWIVQAGGRPMMMANYNGVQVPFYNSTGSGGKAETDNGGWYPFFGVHPEENWLNKTHGDEMADYYGSDELRAIAGHLNKNVGSQLMPSGRINSKTGKEELDVDPDKKIPKAGVHGVQNPATSFTNILNSAMRYPVATQGDGEGVQRNINDVRNRLSAARLQAARRAAFDTGASPSLSTPINEASAAAGSLEAYANRPAEVQEFNQPLNLDTPGMGQ